MSNTVEESTLKIRISLRISDKIGNTSYNKRRVSVYRYNLENGSDRREAAACNSRSRSRNHRNKGIPLDTWEIHKIHTGKKSEPKNNTKSPIWKLWPRKMGNSMDRSRKTWTVLIVPIVPRNDTRPTI